MNPEPHIAHVALGSNLGDRGANLRAALGRLDATPGVRVRRVSSFHEYPAVGGPPDSPPFLNAAAAVETTLGPAELLARLLQIERDCGRVRRASERWGPRTLDLDLLLYGDAAVGDDELTVPHPRMHERRFVLEPLAEIAGGVVHPTLGRDVASLLAELPDGPA